MGITEHKNEFEYIYQTDPSRESNDLRERHPSIELSDHEYLAKKESINKFIRENLQKISQEFDMYLLENQIKEKGMHPNEKDQSKTTTKKHKKISFKSNY